MCHHVSLKHGYDFLNTNLMTQHTHHHHHHQHQPDDTTHSEALGALAVRLASPHTGALLGAVADSCQAEIREVIFAQIITKRYK